MLASSAHNLVLAERDCPIGDCGVAGPSVEASQSRRYRTSLRGFRRLIANCALQANEVQSAFGRGSQISASVARQFKVAVAAYGSATPAKPQQTAHVCTIDVLKISAEGVVGFIPIVGWLGKCSRKMHRATEQAGIEASDFGAGRHDSQRCRDTLKRDGPENERIEVYGSFNLRPWRR